MNKPLQDQYYRDRINQELDTNFLVEAGAGSGKTTSLIKRMIALVKTGKYQVNELAAITFTKKAAAELQERFQEGLEKEYHRKDLAETEKEILKKALEGLDNCFIGTIHSFCARLLRERPVEAGIDPEFGELYDLDQELLLDQAWENYLLNVKLQKPELFARVEGLGISPEELKSAFKMLDLFPEVEVITAKLKKPDLKTSAQALIKFSQQAMEYIPQQEPAVGYDQLQKVVRKVYFLSKYNDLRVDLNLLKIIKAFDCGLSVTLSRWTDQAIAKEYRDQQAAFLKENYVKPVLQQWREYCHYHLVEFIQPAVKYYQRLRREKAVLNFQDLLLKTAALLKNYPEVREYFQAKYRTLLIDEFQDTDPIQAEIIFYLTGSNSSEKDWTKLTPRPGSLFVVGDPKQSIYRFRRADIDTYNLVKDLLQRSGGEVLSLTSNFRSLNAIGKYLNPVFEKQFPEVENSYQAAFAPLNTVREDNEDTDYGVWKLVILKDCSKKEELARQDAKAIAKIIKAAVAGSMKLARTPEELAAGFTEKPSYRDFMILLRYKDMLTIYAQTLEEYGIPVRMSGSSTLNQSLEIKELVKLLAFLEDIDNSVLLVAVLKGLFFGFSDDELYQFKQKGGFFNIYGRIPDNLEESLKARFKRAMESLKEYHQWSKKYPPAVTLEKIMHALGVLPLASIQEMPLSHCANLYYLLERIRDAESKGVTTFQGMVEEVKGIIASSVEKELNLTPEEDAVQIMNLHKAKGLEAPVVFLAHPSQKDTKSPNYHIQRNGLQPRGYFCFTCKRNRYHYEILAQPPDWEQQHAAEKLYQQAEELRLLYVAATRAKNLLIISSSKEKDAKNNPWFLLLHGLGPERVLEVPEISKKPPRKGKQLITPELYHSKREEYSTWMDSLQQPGYKTAVPTEYKDSAALFSIERRAGGGQAWGSVVHKLLEKLVREGDTGLDSYLEKLLQEYELSPERKQELKQLMENFQESDLYQRLQQAEEILTEVPFTLKIEPEDELYQKLKRETVFQQDSREKNTDSVPIILSGVIDLVYKEKDGWVIVDYKTDRAENRADYEKLREIYLNQVAIYAEVWQKITGEKVKEKVISFVNY